ncbi:MAG: preprotein translocase subunit SecG [Clostridia bacterium]|nr:preprotein translocase subunit SecG [Clostridia bacterium]
MTAIQYVLGALLIVLALVLIVSVLLQESRSAGLSGAISGGADTFFGKSKGKTIEQKLAKITKFVALGFFLLALGVSVAFMFMY